MSPTLLVLAACTPKDAEVTGTFHTWLSANSSPTVLDKSIPLGGAVKGYEVQTMDCANPVADRDEGFICPADDTEGPVLHSWLDDDAYYVVQGEVVPWRTEAIITSEGDFQLTVHHQLKTGQDFRYAFVIKPDYQPAICIQENQTCYRPDGEEAADEDGDGWADEADPDCMDGGAWEVGYSSRECNDGVDNDADGTVDGADADCEHAWDLTESSSCGDGEDQDADGWVDLDDPDCQLFGLEDGQTNDAYACSDGVDNDGDTAVDGDDDGCEYAQDSDEGGRIDDKPCSNGLDDDGDGWFDDADVDCDFLKDEAGWLSFACNNGGDDDGDLLVDANDPGCVNSADANEGDLDATCTDAADNDTDGWLDDEDPDCHFGVAEDGAFNGLTACNDGLDNEALDDTAVTEDDGVDAADADCESGLDNEELEISGRTCKDGDELDEDGDGWANAADPDCSGGNYEVGFLNLACNDGVDNDGDTLADAADPGCISAWRITEEDLAVDSDCLDTTAVDDSADTAGPVDVAVDSDGDGWANAEDPGCIFGISEADASGTECANGLDDDGDALVDAADLECLSGLDSRELTNDGCADGADNDGDGWADASDSDCGEAGYEVGFSTGPCADGLDNDGDGDVDGADSGCGTSSDPSEEEGNECADGEDNDGDSWVDSTDPDCTRLGSVKEDGLFDGFAACADAQDNDGDGFKDQEDPDCESPYDNIEDYEDGGSPFSYPLNGVSTLENWSADEAGTLFYLNTGSYQLNPNDDEQFWALPQDWLAGYAVSRFSDEDFTLNGGDVDADNKSDLPRYEYLGSSTANPAGLDPEDPDAEGYAAGVDEWTAAAATWDADLTTYGLMDDIGFTSKIEGNEWRPMDNFAFGMDGWVEVHPSWVLIDTGSELVPGGKASGSYQIFLSGRDAGSKMVLKGSFTVAEIREDKWAYGDLEAQKLEENGSSLCAPAE